MRKFGRMRRVIPSQNGVRAHHRQRKEPSVFSAVSSLLFVAGLLLFADMPVAAAQGVVAHVDGVFHEGAQPFVQGWACQQGNRASVDVKIYADAPKGTLVVAGRADADSDAEGLNHVLFVESCSKAALRFRQAALRATL